MSEITEILKYTLPALIVFLTTFLSIRILIKNEDNRRKSEMTLKARETTLPLQLQAFERLILLLERISPDSLIMRVNSAEKNAGMLKNELISSIRHEFEHNLAQQIYVSLSAWEKLKLARTEMIKLINTAAAEIPPNAPGVNLSKRVLEKAMELGESPTASAINYLKSEVGELL